MSDEPERQNGKSIAQALYAAHVAANNECILMVTRTQFEAFQRHGVPTDHMRIMDDMPMLKDRTNDK